MKRSSILLSILSAAVILTSCSKDEKDDKKKSGLEGQGVYLTQAQRNTLTVTDAAGTALAGAEVLIGSAVDQPFTANFLVTDASGNFTAPDAWTTDQIVTISKPGFIRASYFGQVPNGQTFALRPVPVQPPLELKGKATGFTLRDNDDIMDFALVMPAVQKREMLAFNIDMFISPETDRITVYGKPVDLPSNTSLPKQRERYGIFPVTMDKPLYRLYFEQPGEQKLVTIHGQFPFNKVVKAMQNGKSFIDVINDFTLKGGSLRNIPIVLPTQVLDVPIGEMVFNQPRGFKSPGFAEDEFLLAAALSPWQEQFYPTDFKNVPANTAFNLTTALGDQPQLLLAVKKKAEETKVSGKLSAAFIPFTPGIAPALLPLIETPVVAAYTDFTVALPAMPQGFYEVGAYMTFSTVIKEGEDANGREKEKVTKLWEVYSKSWMGQVSLPKWPNETAPAGVKRWDVLLMATQTPPGNNPVDLRSGLFETVTHATHSATDF
jgi:hypothetical protein